MILKLLRYLDDGNTTLGVLIDEDLGFLCDTLEDEHRDVKVDGETRIPAGVYKLNLKKFGGFHNRYKERFSDIHQGMIWVMGVPRFKDILIHCGNNEQHTKGCILVGKRPPEKMEVWSSAATYEDVYPRIANTIASGEDVWMEVVDSDRR